MARTEQEPERMANRLTDGSRRQWRSAEYQFDRGGSYRGRREGLEEREVMPMTDWGFGVNLQDMSEETERTDEEITEEIVNEWERINGIASPLRQTLLQPELKRAELAMRRFRAIGGVDVEELRQRIKFKGTISVVTDLAYEVPAKMDEVHRAVAEEEWLIVSLGWLSTVPPGTKFQELTINHLRKFLNWRVLGSAITGMLIIVLPTAPMPHCKDAHQSRSILMAMRETCLLYTSPRPRDS